MRRLSVLSALQVSKFLWSDFVFEHGCYFLARASGSNPPPSEHGADLWESFINHTHVFDEFRNDTKAVTRTVTESQTFENGNALDVIEVTFNKNHPDFLIARELGQTAARLWALKLSQDFPDQRFRVYYDEGDGPVVRFHNVRQPEWVWPSEEDLQSGTDSGLEHALIYDTDSPSKAIRYSRPLIH
jgi:hypothetical protein